MPLEDVLHVLNLHGVLPGARKCSTCGRDSVFDANKRAFRCQKTWYDRKARRKKKCNFYSSLFVDTWFGSSKLDVLSVMRFTVLCCVWPKITVDVACEEAGVGREACVDWFSYCREVCVCWSVK